jgi:tyrosyl-tRNA synthetase
MDLNAMRLAGVRLLFDFRIGPPAFYSLNRDCRVRAGRNLGCAASICPLVFGQEVIFLGVLSITVFDELKARGLIAQLTDEEEIKELINAGKATFYIGFDPTADSLHVGHFMALCLMKRLQMAGNRPIALVGGGTGMIGDPSGRTDMRTVMTKETIDYNCERFKEQMSKFIDFSEGKALIVNNADWLLGLNYVEMLREVGAHFSVNRMLSAECYKQRMEKGLSFLEFNYMIMQSYDFYVLFREYGCNMQFGGDDQWSNMLGGTELIRRKLGKDAYAMTITLLLNSEGKKMGKTAAGAVWLDPNKTSPYDFYQYWRNVGDDDVIKCLKMLTFLPVEEIEEMEKWEGAKLNEAKEILAFELTQLVHSTEEAEKSRETSRSLFSAGGAAEMPTLVLNAEDLADGFADILTLLQRTGLCPSRSEARRAIEQGGVEVDGEKITEFAASFGADRLKGGIVIKRGKKKFYRVSL